MIKPNSTPSSSKALRSYPNKKAMNKTEFGKLAQVLTFIDQLDPEILITNESNEYEIEEYQIFDQRTDERKTYQCLLHNGNLVKSMIPPAPQRGGESRTSIKNPINSNSLLYSGKKLFQQPQRSSYLLKLKVKEIASKMSGKKVHVRNKSRNFKKEGEWTHHTARKGELESISELAR